MQPELQPDRVAWGERVKVQDSLGRREAELREMATLEAGTFVLAGLQVLAEQFESGRNTQVHHHHVGRLVQVVSDRRRCCCDVVLRQACAVVSDIDGKWLDSRSFIPRQAIAGHSLVGKATFSWERASDRNQSSTGLG